MRVPNASPVLDKNRAPTGPEILSSTGVGVWRKASKGFPDSSSALDKLQSVRKRPAVINVASWIPWMRGPGRSGVAPANQTKERSVHELFTGAFRNKSSRCESCLFS